MMFSVVIPVYKVEDYLSECVDSVLSQSFQDFEVILVDDGSPDRCPAICDKYAEKDRRIHVIHQRNGGVSKARNSGIHASRGEYIVFLDGDDLLCEHALARMNQCITQNGTSDIIIGNIIYWDGVREWQTDYKQDFADRPQNKTILELNAIYAKQHIQLPWEACHSIFGRSFLQSRSLYFSESLVRAEDVDFYLKTIPLIDKYVLTDINLIKYRLKRAGSAITSPTFRSVWDNLTVFSGAFKDAGIFPNEDLMRSYFADYFAHAILWIAELDDKSEREQCYRLVQENWSILHYTSLRPEYIAGKAVWRLMGLRPGTQFLLRAKRLYKYAGTRIRACAGRAKGD